MGNLARKIIDAVQNLMLDRLFVRLIPVLFIANMWDRLSPPESGTVGLVLLFGVGGLWMLYWVLGAVADLPPKSRKRTPYDTLHEHRPSGFSAWEQEPEDGLRPPAPIRSLVMSLSIGGRSWISVIEGLVFVGAITLAWLLSRKSQAFWSDVHPGLADQASREGLFLAATFITIVLVIRGWALEQRERIAPSRARAPILGAILFGFAFAAMMGMMLSDLLGFGLLPGVVGGVGLLATAIGPPWRARVLEWLFGKREPEGVGP